MLAKMFVLLHTCMYILGEMYIKMLTNFRKEFSLGKKMQLMQRCGEVNIKLEKCKNGTKIKRFAHP